MLWWSSGMNDLSKRALFLVANLSLPTFQVVAVGADLGCAHCRQRVTQVTTRMSGSKEFAVDVCRKQVIITSGTKCIKRKVAKHTDAEEKRIKNPSIKCIKRKVAKHDDAEEKRINSVFESLYDFLIRRGLSLCRSLICCRK
ncbi:heavy metal transport/detoxification superfamily protein [Striga asiatica]|uniref:Heavy metal transport/detoxification superfamily protein n=1 Tax=Striga asiatica TaxID=4170 RepID=A0A5A7P554_STRAF|nr:heavy metal transport/detoxification superfamily protein [Striga asiatica]